MTSTINPAEVVTDDATAANSPRSALRLALTIALATVLFLAAAAGAVFVLVHKSPPAPAPVAQQVPAAPPAATPAPDEQFLDAWHQLAPGVAARRSDNTWLQIGMSTCNLIGMPGATPDVISRVLGSNPSLMSVTEAIQFLGVANAKLCPEKVYVAGPTLTLPNLLAPSVPDFSGLGVPRPSNGSGWIPTHQVSPPSVHAPTIPGTGSSGSSSSAPSPGSHSSAPPSIIKEPPGQTHTEN